MIGRLLKLYIMYRLLVRPVLWPLLQYLNEELLFWLKWKTVGAELNKYEEWQKVPKAPLSGHIMERIAIETKLLDKISKEKGFDIRKYR